MCFDHVGGLHQLRCWALQSTGTALKHVGMDPSKVESPREAMQEQQQQQQGSRGDG